MHHGPIAHRRRPLRFTRDQASRLTLLFLAKHALSGGVPHATDGSHAVYHHEMLEALRATGARVIAADSYEILFNPPPVDFVVPLLNRGGFQNSEMLAPLLLVRAGIPFLGASPMLRGLGDDKHLMKRVANACGVRTADWRIFRRDGFGEAPLPGDWGSMIVKPNASSASWGVKRCESHAAALDHVASLHREGHDAIVEPWIGTRDIAVPVIGGKTPWLLPALAYDPQGSGGLRSYAEKRNLVAGGDDPLEPVEDASLVQRLEDATRRLLPELWPFDYGRFEFRYEPATSEFWFMEVNLSCNLWSKKTIARSAASIGIDHETLVEHIVAQSLLRQGVIQRQLKLRYAA